MSPSGLEASQPLSMSIQSPEWTTWWDLCCNSYCWCAAPSWSTPHFSDGTWLSCLLEVSCFARDSNALFLLATMTKLDDVILYFLSSYQSGHLLCCFVFCSTAFWISSVTLSLSLISAGVSGCLLTFEMSWRGCKCGVDVITWYRVLSSQLGKSLR